MSSEIDEQANNKVEHAFESLKQWREGVDWTDREGDRAWLTDQTLRRYAVGRAGDEKAALKAIESTLVWRAQNYPTDNPLGCER